MLTSHPPDMKIGILLSGGMDSALLLYLLAKHFPNEIQPITVPKHDGAANYVNDIIDWVKKKTKRDINDVIIFGNPDLHHSQILGNTLHRIIHHNIANVYYVGDNIYPMDILPNGPKRVKFSSKVVIYPFFDWYKTDIVSLYVKENILDLLPLTHTCTEQSIGRCNVCWQCRERIWAFKECGLEDLTTT